MDEQSTGAAPENPGTGAPPPTDSTPQPRKRRGRRTILIAAAVVALLVAGVTTWLVWPPDRSPFEQAVAGLAAQPMVDYTASLPNTTRFAGRVTREGDAVGWLTDVSAAKYPFVTVHGQTFVRMDGSLAPSSTLSFIDTGLLHGRWITGDIGDLAALAKQEVTPAAIAGKLRDEVARTADLPTPGDDGTTVDNVAVLKADTPDGTLYVARSQPYRVVRWVDRKALGTVDFATVTADGVDKAYDELETDVGQLGNAVDTGLTFKADSYDDNNFTACAATGCAMTVHFSVTPMPGATVPAEVTATMTVNAKIDDAAAGSCSVTAKVATQGLTTLSCVDTGMNAGYQQAIGSGVPTLTELAKATAYALATVDPTAEGKRLKSLRPDHACGGTTTFTTANGTPTPHC
ncbi:hypothetical protein [Kutzneria buriramensis]|uniref:Uncharacterized protein n=1 Tax=Kutzneria buriramensis TaxID=1045776 RepID=A0A3E0GYJ4_9PSEU|nr:hypothetical protein [Kutzneria buriramensis]REH35238.1 hypothetical protein BCF44_11898 [Kutzneria buriramensis]